MVNHTAIELASSRKLEELNQTSLGLRMNLTKSKCGVYNVNKSVSRIDGSFEWDKNTQGNH
jgi:hypothetical protein